MPWNFRFDFVRSKSLFLVIFSGPSTRLRKENIWTRDDLKRNFLTSCAMALLNFSLPFGPAPTSWATISPIHASPHAVNNLYEPTAQHHENVLHNDDYYKNGPYRHQQQQQQQQQQNSRNYLPPHQQQTQNSNNNRNGYAQTGRMRTYGESSYSQQAPTSFSNVQNSNNNAYYNNGQGFKENPYQTQQNQPQPQTTKAPNSRTTASFQSISNTNNKNYNLNQAAGYPERPPGFKPIQAGQGSRAQNGENFYLLVFFHRPSIFKLSKNFFGK